jgi:hypothetical protein
MILCRNQIAEAELILAQDDLAFFEINLLLKDGTIVGKGVELAIFSTGE